MPYLSENMNKQLQILTELKKMNKDLHIDRVKNMKKQLDIVRVKNMNKDLHIDRVKNMKKQLDIVRVKNMNKHLYIDRIKKKRTNRYVLTESKIN